MAAVALQPGTARPCATRPHLRSVRPAERHTGAVHRPHPAPVYRRRRAGVAAGIAAVIGAVVVGLGSGGAPSALQDAPTAADAAPATVVLEADQTIWDLILPHTPAGAHPMAYAIEVAAYNEIDPRAVAPGTVLRLPPVAP